jgi:hypothetical protein
MNGSDLSEEPQCVNRTHQRTALRGGRIKGIEVKVEGRVMVMAPFSCKTRMIKPNEGQLKESNF